MRSPEVVAIGALCFGVVIGYVTYRTLARKEGAAISDIAAVVAAVGGGAVTALFDNKKTDAFAYYSIGLLAGFALYLILSLIIRGKAETGKVMAAPDDVGPPT